MASKKRTAKRKGKAKQTVSATPPKGENTTVRIPAWQVIALNQIVEEMNADGDSNLNRSHLIRAAVTQYLKARGYDKPQSED